MKQKLSAEKIVCMACSRTFGWCHAYNDTSLGINVTIDEMNKQNKESKKKIDSTKLHVILCNDCHADFCSNKPSDKIAYEPGELKK
jgi:hypothetical protein